MEARGVRRRVFGKERARRATNRIGFDRATRYDNSYADIKRIQNVFVGYGVSLGAVTLY